METLLYAVYKDEDNNVLYRNADGKLHRTDGPAIECSGTKEWWIDGKRHRTDGPAIECADGSKEWWVNGKLHRTDGPAREWPYGYKEYWYGYKEYWIDGKQLTENKFLKRTNVQEFSIDEIANKLGIPVELLKIKK